MNLQDLGYFVLTHLKAIAEEQQAYYLSRYLFGTSLFTPTGEPLDLGARLKQAARQPFELAVQLEAKEKLPCRLICLPLPPEVAAQRRRKAKEKARRQGKTLSQAYLALLDWLLFVTNVPQTMLSIAQVALLYRVRWQIELIFKLWKSYGGLDRIRGLRRERVLSELYAKMIGLILTQFLLAPLRLPDGPAANREISLFKVRDIIERFALKLMESLGHWAKLEAVLSQLFQRIKKFGFKQKRTKRPNICHALALACLEVLEFDVDQEFELPALLA